MVKRKAGKSSLKRASKKLKRKSGSSLEAYNGLSLVVEDTTPTVAESEDDQSEGEQVEKGDWTKLEYTQADSTVTFEELNDEFALNPAILAGLKRNKFICPTPVQRAAIPLALAGSDCLFKAPTGTGKTLAYGLPILSMMCDAASENHSSWRHQVKAIVLVPSKELVSQVADVLGSICFHVLDVVSIWAMPDAPSGNIKEFRLGNQNANILVTQPGALVRLCKQILSVEKRGSDLLLFFPEVKHLVIDEADLILGTFGFHRETSELFRPTAADWNGRSVSIIPTGQVTGSRAQIILASATLNEELGQLKRMALYKPSILCVSDTNEAEKDPMLLEDEVTSLTHLKVAAETDGGRAPIRHFVHKVDRRQQADYLSLFCLLKFQWCSPKTLVFTNSVEQAYKLYLFLQLFGFKVTVASPTQTLSVRLRNIRKFNQSIFNVLVACDEVFNEGEDPILTMDSSKMSCMSRGLDFKGVESIINFDCSVDKAQYVHRCGRAVRDFKRSGLVGTCVSLMGVNEQLSVDDVDLQEILPEDTLCFNSFEYRVRDVCRKLSAKAIKNCQLAEATEEIEQKDPSTFSLADQALLKMAKNSQLSSKINFPALKKSPKYLNPTSVRNPLK